MITSVREYYTTSSEVTLGDKHCTGETNSKARILNDGHPDPSQSAMQCNLNSNYYFPPRVKVMNSSSITWGMGVLCSRMDTLLQCIPLLGQSVVVDVKQLPFDGDEKTEFAINKPHYITSCGN